MQVPPTLVYVPVPASGWQIGSTVATAFAAVVALLAVYINMRQRRADRTAETKRDDDRALAQARLVITGHGNPGSGEHPDDPTTRALLLPITNHSDRPVLRAIGEHWPGGMKITEQPGSVIEPIILPGQSRTFAIPIGRMTPDDVVRTTAWRIRWTDADGRQWCWDRFPQDAPDRYTGQPPTPYGS